MEHPKSPKRFHSGIEVFERLESLDFGVRRVNGEVTVVGTKYKSGRSPRGGWAVRKSSRSARAVPLGAGARRAREGMARVVLARTWKGEVGKWVRVKGGIRHTQRERAGEK